MKPRRSIVVKDRHIQEEIPRVREFIKNADILETYNTIDRGYYGFTIIGLKLLEVLEIALAVFIEVSKQLKNMIVVERGGGGLGKVVELSGDDVRFINLFSLFVASVEAVDEALALESFQGNGEYETEGGLRVKLKNKIKEDVIFKIEEIYDFINRDTSSLPRLLVKDYKSYVQFYRSKGKLQSIKDVLDNTVRYFSVMKNTVRRIAYDSSFDLYREAMEESYVNVLGKVFEGFHYAEENFTEGSSLMDVSVDDIIGNREYLNAAIKLAKDVAGFDFKAWQNPKKINPILFALGNPGCGKTVTAHAVGNFFLDFCRQRDIKARFVIIRRTDWASSYQNASARQLIDIFKRNILEFRGVVGIYWPDIDTAFAARGDAGLRNEEKNILGAVFGLFDGTILPKNGQWFMLTDANYMNMDKATISRITQDPYYVKGPETPHDFVALFRDVKLRHHKEFLKVSEKEWEKFGKLCVENKLSGRSIDNMSRKAIAMIEDFEYPDEYFKVDFDAKRNIIKKYSKVLSYDDLEKLLKNYVQFEKEAEEKAYRKRFQDRVNEIITYLSAQRIAQKTIMAME